MGHLVFIASSDSADGSVESGGKTMSALSKTRREIRSFCEGGVAPIVSFVVFFSIEPSVLGTGTTDGVNEVLLDFLSRIEPPSLLCSGTTSNSVAPWVSPGLVGGTERTRCRLLDGSVGGRAFWPNIPRMPPFPAFNVEVAGFEPSAPRGGCCGAGFGLAWENNVG